MTENATLRLRRHFPAPPHRLYAAWTTQALFAAWIGPVGVPCTVHALDATPGGGFRLDMHLPDGTLIKVAGTFTRLDPPHAIQMTWGAADGSVMTAITITFQPDATGTWMDFTQALPDPGMVASHDAGWTSAFTKLHHLTRT